MKHSTLAILLSFLISVTLAASGCTGVQPTVPETPTVQPTVTPSHSVDEMVAFVRDAVGFANEQGKEAALEVVSPVLAEEHLQDGPGVPVPGSPAEAEQGGAVGPGPVRHRQVVFDTQRSDDDRIPGGLFAGMPECKRFALEYALIDLVSHAGRGPDPGYPLGDIADSASGMVFVYDRSLSFRGIFN